MEIIGPEVAQSYAGFGILAITNLALVAAIIYLYRSKEAYRKEAEAVISELQEKRITEQAKGLDAIHQSTGVTAGMKLSTDNVAATQIDIRGELKDLNKAISNLSGLITHRLHGGRDGLAG